jgi:hypothetical protein
MSTPLVPFCYPSHLLRSAPTFTRLLFPTLALSRYIHSFVIQTASCIRLAFSASEACGMLYMLLFAGGQPNAERITEQLPQDGREVEDR